MIWDYRRTGFERLSQTNYYHFFENQSQIKLRSHVCFSPFSLSSQKISCIFLWVLCKFQYIIGGTVHGSTDTLYLIKCHILSSLYLCNYIGRNFGSSHQFCIRYIPVNHQMLQSLVAKPYSYTSWETLCLHHIIVL